MQHTIINCLDKVRNAIRNTILITTKDCFLVAYNADKSTEKIKREYAKTCKTGITLAPSLPPENRGMPKIKNSKKKMPKPKNKYTLYPFIAFPIPIRLNFTLLENRDRII